MIFDTGNESSSQSHAPPRKPYTFDGAQGPKLCYIESAVLAASCSEYRTCHPSYRKRNRVTTGHSFLLWNEKGPTDFSKTEESTVLVSADAILPDHLELVTPADLIPYIQCVEAKLRVTVYRSCNSNGQPCWRCLASKGMKGWEEAGRFLFSLEDPSWRFLCC